MVPVVGVRFFGIGRAVLRYLERLVSHDTTFRVLSDLRKTIYLKMETQLPSFDQSAQRGEATTRVVSDVENLQEAFLRIAYPLAVSCLLLVVAFIFLYSSSPLLGILLLATYLPALLVPVAIGIRSRGVWRASVNARQALTGEFLEFVTGIMEIRIHGREKDWLLRMQEATRKERLVLEKTDRQAALSNAFAQAFPSFGTVAFLTVGCFLCASGQWSGPWAATLPLAVTALFEAMQPIFSLYARYEKTAVSSQRIFGDVVAKMGVDDTLKGIIKTKDILIAEGSEVSIKNLSFSWPNGRQVLNSIDLSLKSGEVKGIIGPSGIGKTTLLNILEGFLPAYVGTVKIDGYPVNEYNATEIRKKIAVVDQVHTFFKQPSGKIYLSRNMMQQMKKCGKFLIRWI